jgi:predicted membrane protein
MHVIECDVPPASALSRELIDNSSFHDSWRAPLTRPELGIVEIFFALFGHTPLWMKSLLIVRNAAARLVGLEAPTVAEIMQPKVRETYSVGEKIGPWPIFFIDDSEIVAGRNNKHLDFRVSVLKTADGEKMNVVISTICTVHNLFGKIYLLVIVPFHRNGVKSLMRNAVVAKRL